MNIIDLSTFKLNIYEGEIPSDKILNTIIEDCKEGNLLLNFSQKYEFIFDENMSYDERINYFSTLIRIIVNKSGNMNYTEDDIVLYIHFNALLKHRNYVINDFNKDISILENLLNLNPSTEAETYIKESLKYLLLE